MKDFYSCNNPLAEYSKGLIGYMYHGARPSFMAAIFEIDQVHGIFDQEFPMQNLLFVYISGDGNSRVLLFAVTELIDKASFDKTALILKMAAKWYATCLNITDQKSSGKTSGLRMLQDYQDAAPGLQVLHLETPNIYILSHYHGFRSFNDAGMLDQYITKTLGYPDTTSEVSVNTYIAPAKNKAN